MVLQQAGMETVLLRSYGSGTGALCLPNHLRFSGGTRRSGKRSTARLHLREDGRILVLDVKWSLLNT